MIARPAAAPGAPPAARASPNAGLTCRVLVLALVLALWLVAAEAEVVGAQAAGADGTAAADSAARVTIAMELRAFYRDLGARQWPSLTTHFWPAKVGARWQHPDWEWPDPRAQSPAVAGARSAAPCESDGNRPYDPADLERAVQIAGRWARVVVQRCPGSVLDHFWLLAMSGQWKIVRLTHEHPR